MKAQVYEMICDQLGLHPNDFDDETTLEGLGMTEIDKTQIVIGIEDETGFVIPDHEVDAWEDVGDIIRSAKKAADVVH